jgi:hypothetical protein
MAPALLLAGLLLTSFQVVASQDTGPETALAALRALPGYTFEVVSESEGGPLGGFGGGRGGRGGRGGPGGGGATRGVFVRGQPLQLTAGEQQLWRVGDLMLHQDGAGVWAPYQRPEPGGFGGRRGGGPSRREEPGDAGNGEGEAAGDAGDADAAVGDDRGDAGGSASGGASGGPQDGGPQDGGPGRGGRQGGRGAGAEGVPDEGVGGPGADDADGSGGGRGGRGGGRGGLGGPGSSAFALMRLSGVRAPEELLSKLLPVLVDVTSERSESGVTWTGSIPDEALEDLGVGGGMGGGRRGGFGGGGAADGDGDMTRAATATIATDAEGRPVSIELVVDVQGIVFDEPFAMLDTTRYELSDLGSSAIDLPEGLGAFLEF